MNDQGFYNAKTFYDVLQLYIEYLDGKSNEVPTYHGKLNPDTFEQLQQIRQLNNLGFLTLDSQNGLIEDSPDTIKLQRSYIKGLMPTFIVNELVDKFNLQSEVLCFTEQLKFSMKNEIADPRIWVTIKKNKQTLEVDYQTSIPLVQTQDYFHQIAEYLNKNTKKLLFNQLSNITLIDTVWERPNYLVDLCNSFLKEIVNMYERNINWKYICTLTRDPQRYMYKLKSIAENTSSDAYNICNDLTQIESIKNEESRKQFYEDVYTDSDIANNVYQYHKQFYKYNFPSVSSISGFDDENVNGEYFEY